MKVIFLIEYSIYIFSRFDALAESRIIPLGMHSKIWVMYTTLLLLQFLIIKFKEYKCTEKIILSKNFYIMIFIFITYFFVAFGEYTFVNTELSMINMLLGIYFASELIIQYRCFRGFILASVGVLILYLSVIVIINDADLLSLIENVSIETYFSTRYSTRFRFSFGLCSPNAVGSIGECSLLIAFMMFTIPKITDNKILLRINNVFILLLNFFSALMIIISGCRGAIVSTLVFLVMFLYLRIVKNKTIKHNQIMIMNVFFIVTMAIIIYITGVGSKGIGYYFSSGRRKAFYNLAFLNNMRRILLGIGFPETAMENLYIDGISGDILDNYYIYIVVTTGIIGAGLIMYSLVKLGIALYKNITLSTLNMLIFCCYISLLIYGTVESCVLLPFAPTSEVYFPIFLSSIVNNFGNEGIKVVRYQKENC